MSFEGRTSYDLVSQENDRTPHVGDRYVSDCNQNQYFEKGHNRQSATCRYLWYESPRKITKQEEHVRRLPKMQDKSLCAGLRQIFLHQPSTSKSSDYDAGDSGALDKSSLSLILSFSPLVAFFLPNARVVCFPLPLSFFGIFPPFAAALASFSSFRSYCSQCFALSSFPSSDNDFSLVLKVFAFSTHTNQLF